MAKKTKKADAAGDFRERYAAVRWRALGVRKALAAVRLSAKAVGRDASLLMKEGLLSVGRGEIPPSRRLERMMNDLSRWADLRRDPAAADV